MSQDFGKSSPVENPLDPAAGSAVAALQDDPFYQSITVEFTDKPSLRKNVLEEYFSFSIQEGRELGRVLHLPDPSAGVSVWLLPGHSQRKTERANKRKRDFLVARLGLIGTENYYGIVNYMTPRAAELAPSDAWYLSIIAVNPAAQGRGLGQALLAPTLSDADRLARTCYLETFTPRNVRFYERLDFATKAQISEPITGKDYLVMVRSPAVLAR